MPDAKDANRQFYNTERPTERVHFETEVSYNSVPAMQNRARATIRAQPPRPCPSLGPS